MTEFEKGYEQGYKDGMAGAALPNVNDNGDKIDGYSYAYKTDSNGEPYIHIDSVRSMLKKAADVQPVKHGRWIDIYEWAKMHDSTPSGICTYYWCSECQKEQEKKSNFCPNCGARMDGDTE